MKNKEITLAERPTGMPTDQTFSLVESKIPSISESEALVRSLYVSVDPYMRGRMSDAKSYAEPFPVGKTINGGVIAEVIESNSSKFEIGDIVLGTLGWREYSAINEKHIRKVDSDVAPISTFLGALGMTGLTAYFGLLEIGKPKEGETVVVSGAAGAVGSVVGQIAKIQGAHVVGITGSDEKANLIKSQFGFDAAINYKTETNLVQAIKNACPNGVDVYFDNVGGEISDAVLKHLNNFARIPVCGAISSYNLTDPDLGQRVQGTLVKTRSRMQGFLVNDFSDRFGEATEQLAIWLKENRIQSEETIINGFENIPEAFISLFKGKNKGKLLVKIAEPNKG